MLAGVPQSCCVVYLDYLLVHAADFKSALASLHEVFPAFCPVGLCLHPKKGNLFWRETAFLGRVVSRGVGRGVY